MRISKSADVLQESSGSVSCMEPFLCCVNICKQTHCHTDCFPTLTRVPLLVYSEKRLRSTTSKLPFTKLQPTVRYHRKREWIATSYLSTGVFSMSCDLSHWLTSNSSNSWMPLASFACHVCSKAVTNNVNIGWRVSKCVLGKQDTKDSYLCFHQQQGGVKRCWKTTFNLTIDLGTTWFQHLSVSFGTIHRFFKTPSSDAALIWRLIKL